MPRPLSLAGIALLAALGPVCAAPSPASCQAMVDKADQVWSLKRVAACAPWRKQHFAALNKAAAQCHARKSEDLNACDAADEKSQRFWEEVQLLESAGNKP